MACMGWGVKPGVMKKALQSELLSIITEDVSKRSNVGHREGLDSKPVVYLCISHLLQKYTVKRGVNHKEQSHFQTLTSSEEMPVSQLAHSVCRPASLHTRSSVSLHLTVVYSSKGKGGTVSAMLHHFCIHTLNGKSRNYSN